MVGTQKPTNMNKYKINKPLRLVTAIVLAVVFVIGGVLGIGALATRQPVAVASIPIGSSYNSTTTYSGFGNLSLANHAILKATQGTFGSVIITGANTGTMTIYDATTSNALIRTNTATTTLAVFPASIAAGTYTFDSNFFYGLMVDYSGAVATSTITSR